MRNPAADRQHLARLSNYQLRHLDQGCAFLSLDCLVLFVSSKRRVQFGALRRIIREMGSCVPLGAKARGFDRWAANQYSPRQRAPAGCSQEQAQVHVLGRLFTLVEVYWTS
ncbi:hypothetical protein J1614_003081 [Plenodomus biglobosus]|nr:hypothetical protein J1614_003081 [Plenodomus biglobosus]